MKTRSIFPVILLVLSTAFGVFAQTTPERYRSGHFGFEIDQPARPNSILPKQFSSGGFMGYGLLHIWSQNPTTVATLETVPVFKNDPNNQYRDLTKLDKESAIIAYKKAFLAEWQKLGVSGTGSPYVYDGVTGSQDVGLTPERTIVSRVFFLRSNIIRYVVSSGELTKEELLKKLDTFRLLNKAETIAALKAENEPAEVSQDDPAMRLGNDLQANGFKGSVCGVLEEFVTPPATVKEREHEWYFNEAGNLLREVSYHNGYPQEMTQWGWINGKRISSTRIIHFIPPEGYKFSTGPMTKVGPLTGMMGQENDDAPFATRHEFKYDEKGRVTEQAAYDTKGKMTWKKNFVNTPTGREVQMLDEYGSFLSRIFEAYDKNGNISEYRILDLSGKEFQTTRYTYDFDPTGNWTVRKSFKGKAIPAKTAKPFATTFRTINYCE